MLLNLLNYFILILMVLNSISFFTLFERKLLGYIQLRLGPSKISFLGIFQSFSDGLKLFSKELFILKLSGLIYYMSPFLMFLISFLIWFLFPFKFYFIDFTNYMMIMFCLLSLNVYPVMFAGVFSNNIYSIIGGIRAISQTISYEVSFILIVFSYLIIVDSMNLISFFGFEYMFFFFFFPLAIIFYVSILAELNRLPFDFIESESELISGYSIEYMSGNFTLIFLSEYSNIIYMSFLFVCLNFCFGYSFVYFCWLFFLYVVVLVRSLFPRFRYDKLMFMVWLNYLPFSLNFLLYIIFMKYFLFYYY